MSLIATLSYFYQMLSRCNDMAIYKPTIGNFNRGSVTVNQTPVREVTVRTANGNIFRGLKIGTGGDYFSFNSRPAAQNDSISQLNIPYGVVTTQTFGEWKRTLTNEQLSLDGGLACYISNITTTGSFRAPTCIMFGSGDSPNFVPNNSLYSTDEYDNYLVVIGFISYDESKNVVSGVYAQARSRATSCFSFNNNNNGKNIANDTNNLITFSPLDCIPNRLDGNSTHYLVDIYTVDANKTMPRYIVSKRIAGSTNVPYTIAYRGRTNTLNQTYRYGDDELPSSHTFRECEAVVYLFPDFESIQKWFIDFGIKAYASVADMNEDNFPDLDGDDLGYDEDPTPTIEDNLPDNTSDDTIFATPALSNLDLYNIYLLNRGSFTDFKHTLLTRDIWQGLQNWLTNPTDCIYSLRIFPFNFVDHNPSGVLYSDDLILLTSTLPNIPCYKVLSSYIFTNFNMGELIYYPYYGNYLDYYADYTLFCPCCQPIQLDPSTFLGKLMKLRGIIDFVSGDITVNVIVDDKIIQSTSGNISYSLSLSFDNVAQIQSNIILNKLTTIGIGALSGGGIGALAAASVGVATAPIEMMTTPVHAKHIGSMSYNNAIYNYVNSYLQIELPIPSKASNGKQLKGLSSWATVKINQLEGYCKGTPYGDWDILGATVEEINMIKQIIQTGFYI